MSGRKGTQPPYVVARDGLNRGRGARDSNPGPHGPQPAQRHVLEYPRSSLRVRRYSIAADVVSSCDLLYPPVSGNA